MTNLSTQIAALVRQEVQQQVAINHDTSNVDILPNATSVGGGYIGYHKFA